MIFKERPILFSAEMVRAILEGRKTMTRRALKWQPLDIIPCPRYQIELDNGDIKSCVVAWVALTTTEPEPHGKMIRCRYGQPGDRLWVRETFSYTGDGDTITNQILYRSDGEQIDRDPIWRPSIHMPRWASRITLEIVNVKVERLQDISEADAQKEGMSFIGSRAMFAKLWDSINAKRGYSWESNPWIWAIEFKRVEG